MLDPLHRLAALAGVLLLGVVPASAQDLERRPDQCRVCAEDQLPLCHVTDDATALFPKTICAGSLQQLESHLANHWLDVPGTCPHCAVRCWFDANCDDQDPCTIDFCDSDGATAGACHHQPDARCD